ncbi:hypothetical protein ACIBI2_34755 [Streptosporangium canum]|uniref:hypothetical protein n=1 Tax=Streptosporangium canum TaxID=324952 RepID=UPI00378A80D9
MIVAGDAAHVHSPADGQGMDVGRRALARPPRRPGGRSGRSGGMRCGPPPRRGAGRRLRLRRARNPASHREPPPTPEMGLSVEKGVVYRDGGGLPESEEGGVRVKRTPPSSLTRGLCVRRRGPARPAGPSGPA